MLRASERTGGSACRMGGRLVSACTAAALMLSSAAACGAVPGGERPDLTPQPWVTMSLGSLGVPSIPQSFLQVGSSMFTLDLVDDTHLLLTFSSRGLVPRDPSDSPGDEARMVAAELVELPTGKILARADWKMHDHARYLWRLGKGRFLLRMKDNLFLLTPEARLHDADPLQLVQFPKRDGMPVSVMISPEKAMLTVETMAPAKKDAALSSGSSGLIVTDPKPAVTLDFYRMSGGDSPAVPLTLKGVGSVKAPAPVLLPMDADGYLWPDDAGRGRWPVSFNEFGGREVKIGQVDSSCAPRLQMVSRFEFLAFTCMGSDARVRMRSYGMDGHETWEETLNGTYGNPELAYAPDAGRFALSRIVASTPDLMLGTVIPEGATQEVRVYQTESGDLLLKVPTSPVTRFAENFDLSEDGLVAAVVNAGTIQVYKLRPPSAQDLKDLADARSFSPPKSEAPVSFAKLTRPENADESASPGTSVASTRPAAANTAPKPAAAPAPATEVKRVDVSTAPGGVGGGAGDGKPAERATTDRASDTVTPAEVPVKGNVAADDAASGDPATGDDADSGTVGRRNPPTLLQPGESIEKVKPPTQARQQPPK